MRIQLKIRFSFSLFLSFFLLVQLCSQSVFDDFNTGVQLGHNGKYRESLDYFQRIAQSGYHSPSLDYNIGSAYLGSDSIGKAILYLERALKYFPNDLQTRRNIQLARSKMTEAVIPVTPFFISEWIKNLNGSLSLTAWAGITILMIWICVIILCIKILKINWKFQKKEITILIISAIFLGVSLFMTLSSYQRIYRSNTAVLTSKSVYLKVGPDELSTSYGLIYEGEKLDIKNQIGAWFQVELLNRDIGWIKMTDVTRL